MKSCLRSFVFRGIAAVALICAAAFANAQDVALLLQQSPANGGTLNILPGVHRFSPNSEVQLIAVPKPGYQFVYWLGDVRDSTANSTILNADAPKIVIAVFERAKYDFLILDQMPVIGNAAGGSFRSPVEQGSNGQGEGAKKPPHWSAPNTDMGDDFPVPEVPEPATILLLGVGVALFSFFRRRR